MPTSTKVHLQTSKILISTQISHHLALPKPFNSNPSPKKPCHRPVLHATKASLGSGGPDFRKLERVIRLNSAIKNRSIKELLSLAAEECRDFFYVLPTLDPVELSKSALGIFYAFLVANRIQFVIKPTKGEGVDFGIKWRLDWPEMHLPLGSGCRLYASQTYHGTVFIRKGKNTLEPLCQVELEPLGVMLEKMLLPLIDKMVPSSVVEGKRRITFLHCLLSLVFMVIFVVLFNNTFV